MIWTSVRLEKSVKKVADFEIRQDVRFDNNAKELDSHFLALSASRKIAKWLDIGVSFRWTNYEERFRFAPTLYLRHKLNRIEFKLRSKWDFNFNGNGSTEVFRNKMSVAYRKKKLDWRPSLGLEIFQSSKLDYINLSKYRMFVKLRYKINKASAVQMGYLIQEELNRANPQREYILQLNYSRSL